MTKGSRIGLALGSGGARGWCIIGVIRELEDAGIHFDVITGASIGALIGGFHSLGKLDELERFGKTLTNRKLLSLMNLTFTGASYFSGKKLMNEAARSLGAATFEDCVTPLGIVATEIGNGHEGWLRRGSLATAIAASCALPGVLDPVKINGAYYMDGAMVDPVPVTLARAMGADVVIAVSMLSDTMFKSRQIHDILEGSDASRTVEHAIDTSLWRFLPGHGKKEVDRPPPTAVLMGSALDIMLDRIRRSRLAGDPPDVSIGVRCDDYNMFDFHKCAELIELGRSTTKAMMPMILQSLNRTCSI